MRKEIVEDQIFSGVNFLIEGFPFAEYDHCTFKDCTFAGLDLSEYNFADCKFDNCDLSNVKLAHTGFKTVGFKSCKLLGLIYSDCNDFLFAVNFEDCLLNIASFYRLNLRNTKFKNCQIQEADFTEANLSGASFDDCDLNGTTFERTNLEKADLRSAYNYSINPDINKIKKAQFSLPAVVGLLDHYGISIE